MVTNKHFALEYADDVTILDLVDPHRFNDFGGLHTEVAEFVDGEQPAKLLIDFSTLSYCPTSVINAMLLAKKHLATHKGELKLCGMTDATRESFRTLDFDGTIFDIYETREAALASF